MTTAPSFRAKLTIAGSNPSLVRNWAPASKQRRAVSTSDTPPAPTITSGAFCTRWEITLCASGTVNVTSTMGIPPLDTASAANSASSVEDARTAGIIPTSSIRLRTSCLFTNPTPFANAHSVGQSRQIPDAHRFSKLLQRQKIRGDRLAVGQLRGSITALGVEKIQKAGRAALVGVLADVPVFLGDVEIARAVQNHNLVVGTKAFIGIAYVGQSL